MSMEDTPPTLTPFEKETLLLLVDPDGSGDSALRKQLSGVKPVKREPTGAGLYVTLEVPENAPKSEIVKRAVGNVSGKCAQLKNGFGAVAFVENGSLSLLEFYTFDEPWPEEVTEYQLQQG